MSETVDDCICYVESLAHSKVKLMPKRNIIIYFKGCRIILYFHNFVTKKICIDLLTFFARGGIMNRFFRSAVILSLMAMNSISLSQENIIQNGCFLDTTSNVWAFNPNSAIASRSYQSVLNSKGVIVSRKCKIEITQKGNSENSPQLSQSGINLLGGEGYTLKYIASSSRSGTIRVILRSGENVLFDSVAGLLNTNATPKKGSVSFFTDNNIANATLEINMGLFDGTTNIALDSIFLVKRLEPTIRVTTPTSKDRWISGTERQIIWQNSGLLEKVMIKYTNGAAWKVITSAATNQKSFWWKIPADVYGDACKIIVSSLDGKVADTSEVFRILKSGTVDEKELVKNGDFLDTTDWEFHAYSSAKATGKIQNDQFVIKVDTIGTDAWHVQLEQRNLSLEVGKTYKLEFDAYSSHQRDILINVGEQDSPYRSAFGNPVPYPIGTEKSTVVHYFSLDPSQIPTDLKVNEMRVEFNCANDTGTVYLDNVSLLQVDGIKCMVTKPYIGSVLKSGSEFNIQWTDESTMTIDLQYSLDSGKTWNSIADSIANLQAFLWIVPLQSSKNCQIRIKDSQNDSIIGSSAFFQINKFGTAVKVGELVNNGTFVNGMNAWNSLFDGASGEAFVENGYLNTNIQSPGSSLNSIIISQGNINVLGETEYTLSFKMFSNGTRDMKVRVTGDDTIVFLDSTFNVPNVMQNITLNLKTTVDAVAKIEFLVGGSRASVSIDDVSFHVLGWVDIKNKPSITKNNNQMITFTVHNNVHGSILFTAGKNVLGQIAVYNLNGTMIRTLKLSEKVFWDGKDSHGASVAPGTYIAKLTSNMGNKVNKFLMRR